MAKKKSEEHYKEHHPHQIEHHTKHQEPKIIHVSTPQDNGINKVMLENFVSLQKVMTNLSIKLDGLTTQISKLLDLFEISAKALAEKDFEVEKDNKHLLDKMNNLLDQNKILARGLSLVHERIPREQQQYYSPPAQVMQVQQPAQTQQYMREIPQPPPSFPQPSSFQSLNRKPFSSDIQSSTEIEPNSFESPIEEE